MRVLITLLTSISLLGCSPDVGQLHVDLITDLAPMIEFDGFRLDVGEGAYVQRWDAPATDYLQGLRVDSLELDVGATTVSVTLFLGPMTVARRRVVVEMGAASQVVTVVISRDCRGVLCPVSGNPSLDTCLGGECVDPRCTPESPEYCTPECTQDSQCSDEFAECARPICSGGVCLGNASDVMCRRGEYCDGTVGCRSLPNDLSVRARFPWNGFNTGSVHVLNDAPLPYHPLRPKLMWDGADAAEYYQVQMTRECATDGFRSCPFLSPELDQTTTDTTFFPATSLPVAMTAPVGSRYVWRVRACTADHCGDWTEPRYLNVGKLDGDYNGDGFGDIVVGAFGEERAYLYLGSALGLSTSPSLTLAAPTEARRGRFGVVVACVGDLNADGFSDFVVSAPIRNGGDGGAFLYLGQAEGFSATPSVSLLLEPGAGIGFGNATSGGDLNGDGYDDLLIGASATANPEEQEGNVFVYFGGAEGVEDPALIIDSPHGQVRGSFGVSVAAIGDANGDGYVDVAIGASGPQMDEIPGITFVYFGAAELPLAPDQGLANPRPSGPGGGLHFGFEVAAGDLNGDGYADLLVGGKDQSAPETLEGNVFLYLGGAEGFPVLPIIFDNPSDQPSALFGGWLVSGGDFNGDGFDDLVVGAIRQDRPEHDEGNAFAYYGTDVGPADTPSITFDNPLDQIDGFFGEGGASGDFNGDGYLDLAVGGPRQFVDGQPAGAVYVFPGGPSGLVDVPTTTIETPNPQSNGWFGGGGG